MNPVIHQVRMTLDLSSTSDNSNVELSSTASEAARHRMKMTQLRREFLSNPGACLGVQQLESSIVYSIPTVSVLTSSSINPGEFTSSFAFAQPFETNSQGSDPKAVKPFSYLPQSNAVLPASYTPSTNGCMPHRLSMTNSVNATSVFSTPMTSSVPKGRPLSLVKVEHANERSAYLDSSPVLTPPDSKVHIDSTHTESPDTLSQHMFDNRSCATCVPDWPTTCHDSHRPTTELVSSYRPITLHSPSSSPTLKHIASPNNCLPVDGLCVPMPHHPSHAYSNQIIDRTNQMPHQPLRQFSRSMSYGDPCDSRSASSGSKRLSSPVCAGNQGKFVEHLPSSMMQEQGSSTNGQNEKRSSGQGMDYQLHKMRTTLKDFNIQLSQIDSTLGRIQSFGSLNQYLASASDPDDMDPDADVDEPLWNPRHTPPPLVDHNQLSNTTSDHLSSRSDVGNSFECETGIVTAHRTTDVGRQAPTLSSSLGASLSTLSSSVWSSLSSSVIPTNGNMVLTRVPNSVMMSKTTTNNAHAKVENWNNDLSATAAPNSPIVETVNHPLTPENSRKLDQSKFDTEFRARASQADALRFVDSSSSNSSRNYDPDRRVSPTSEKFRSGTEPNKQVRVIACFYQTSLVIVLIHHLLFDYFAVYDFLVTL